jgi:hypothetical protein
MAHGCAINGSPAIARGHGSAVEGSRTGGSECATGGEDDGDKSELMDESRAGNGSDGAAVDSGAPKNRRSVAGA